MTRSQDPLNDGKNSRLEILQSWFTKERLLPLLVFVWPFIYLHNYVIPWGGKYTGISNDFNHLYYVYKFHLLSNLAAGHFPLWSPGEGGGYPFYSSPFTQVFYPFNVLLLLWYKIVGGYDYYHHQIFTIAGISIFCLGLFTWLRGLKVSTRAALISALIMGASFKITEILRFPNALHVAAWYPWILYSINRSMQCESWKACLKQGGLLGFFLICMCTAGYPYYIYYSIFLFVPYTAAHCVPVLRRWLIPSEKVNLVRGLTTLSVSATLAAGTCGLYFYKLMALMGQTVDRGGKSLKYSTAHNFDFADTIGSLIFPPCAQTEGWYFFSITALLIISLYLVRVFLVTTNDREEPYARWGIGVLLAWIAVISCISYGRESHLFVFLWHSMPGFSSLRVWGRLNIVLIPIIALLLAKSYTWLDSYLAGRADGMKRVPVVLIFAFIYSIILAMQRSLLVAGKYDYYWGRYVRHAAQWDRFFLLFGIAAFFALLIVLLVRRISWKNQRRYLWLSVFFLVLVAAVEMHPVGANTWIRSAKKTMEATPKHVDMNTFFEDSLKVPRVSKKTTLLNNKSFNVGVIPNWYFERYIKFRKATRREAADRKAFLGVKGGRRIFLSSRIEHRKIKGFLKDSNRFEGHAEVKKYNGDRLELSIDSRSDGYVSFVDNWDPDWRASLDGREVKIELLFGTFKAVHFPAGKHEVAFHYRPFH
ncbi:MAG: YfhO family protein [Deltaproteobacteria bacterium]|nr:YfhO family protein [Deltaproteobacteria bacterium]